jgi:RNA polymerase sigma-70 factor, ECF subfamily
VGCHNSNALKPVNYTVNFAEVNLTDQELFRALRDGDINAFEMYFKNLYQPLCNYANSFLYDREESEEIVQATFLTVWEKRETLNVSSSVKSYLYAMVRNACLNLIKHEKIKQKYAVEASYTNEGYDGVMETVTSVELEDRIAKAIEQLPEQCRLVFKLSRFEELKYQEIADQLEISVKTVENHIGKALKLMREHLKDYLPLLIGIFFSSLLTNVYF